MLIIIHLPSNYTPGLSGISHIFHFLLPTAGLAAGAAGLTDREVTTRGQPHVIFSHTYTLWSGGRGGGGGVGKPSFRGEEVFISSLALSFFSGRCFHT